MAQKVNPLAVRLGVNRGADSSWFSDYYYATLLSQDLNLREYLLTVTNRAAGTAPLDFKPGRCVIHHYPKNSFVHLFFCRLVKNTKRPRSLVTKRKPLYSYDSILPSLKQQTAPFKALRVDASREASLGAFAPKAPPTFNQQHTGAAKSGEPAQPVYGATRNTHAVFKHPFVKHIFAEVLLAKRQPDVLSGGTPPVLSDLWYDEIAKGRLLQTTTEYGPPTTQRPTGVALGLKLAKLVEARLHEVRCALAFHKALQPTTPSECSGVNKRRCKQAIAPSSLRHKHAPKLRAVQLAGFLMNAAMPFHQGQPSQAHIIPKQTQMSVLLGTNDRSPAAAHLFKNVSSLRPSGKPSTRAAALRADPWLASSSPTLRAETTVRSTPLSEAEGPYGRLDKKRQTRPSALLVVSSTSGFSPFTPSLTAAPVAELTKPSPNGPAPGSQFVDLRRGTWCLWWPESRLALRRINHHLSLLKGPTLPAGLHTTRTTGAFYEQPQRLCGLLTKAAPQALTRTNRGTSDKPPEEIIPLAASTAGWSQPLNPQGSPESFDHLASLCLTPALVKQLDTLGDWPSGHTCATNSGALLGGLLIEEAEADDAGTPEPLGVLSQTAGGAQTSTCAQVSGFTASNARVAQPYAGQNTTKSVWRPLVSTVHNFTQLVGPAVSPNPIGGPMANTPLGLLTQALTCRMPGKSPLTSDLHCADVAVRQHWLFRKHLCSPRRLATLNPSESSSANQALSSNTGTKCQMLKLKRLFKPFLLESVPHFPKLLRLSGWTRLAMHQARAWPLRQNFQPLSQNNRVSTQAPAGDFLPPAETAVVRFNKKKALVGVRRLKEGLNHNVLPSGEPSHQDLNATKQHQHATPLRGNRRRATGVFTASADNTTKGWLTQSCLHYYVMHYFSLCKTNRSCADVHAHVQHVQRHVKEARYLELPLKQSSHFLWSNIQSRIESHTGTFTSILPMKLSSVGYQSAYLVAHLISLKLEQKKSFRQICRSIFKQMDLCQNIIKGIRIKCSGRLNGAEIAKTECRKYGETSLHVFSDKIDYAHTKASTPYGILGVKVWIAYV